MHGHDSAVIQSVAFGELQDTANSSATEPSRAKTATVSYEGIGGSFHKNCERWNNCNSQYVEKNFHR